MARWSAVCLTMAVLLGGVAAAADKAAPPALPKETPAKEPSAKDPEAEEEKSAGGLPIPRFVSLRTNPINLRTGPGVRYPVAWVFMRRYLPVEVIGEFDTWRQVRDPDGAEGWVHQSMLSGRRTAMITGEIRKLLRTAADDAESVATLEPGVVVNIQRCPAATEYCRVEVQGLQGWLKRGQFWGVYPEETLQ